MMMVNHNFHHQNILYLTTLRSPSRIQPRAIQKTRMYPRTGSSPYYDDDDDDGDDDGDDDVYDDEKKEENNNTAKGDTEDKNASAHMIVTFLGV